MSNTLLPCPFCGSENIVTTDFGASTWFVQCDDCGATFPHFDTETEAIAAWNRRAGDDTNVTTNADRIRSMSDEELHKFLLDFEAGNIDYAKTFCDLCCKDAALEQKSTDCDGCLLWWLKNDATLPQGIDSPYLFSSFFKPRRNTTARN
jgi:Lar family restriction alleviation protein